MFIRTLNKEIPNSFLFDLATRSLKKEAGKKMMTLLRMIDTVAKKSASFLLFL